MGNGHDQEFTEKSVQLDFTERSCNFHSTLLSETMGSDSGDFQAAEETVNLAYPHLPQLETRWGVWLLPALRNFL